MYYLVTNETIKYNDHNGVERRAARGSIVNIMKRTEAKRLLKDKSVQVATDDMFTTDKNMMIRLDVPADDADEPTPRKKSKAKSTAENASLEAVVGSLVDLDGEVGEVIAVHKKTMDVRFGDSEDSRRVKISEVEVIG